MTEYFVPSAVDKSALAATVAETDPRILRAMVGASLSAGGKSGTVPQPAAGDKYQALRGDGTYDTTLHIDTVQAVSGTNEGRVARFVGPTTPAATDSYWVFRSTNDGARSARMVATLDGSATDTFCDAKIEPTGQGRITENGNPVATDMLGKRSIVAIPYGTTFTTNGLPAPTVNGTPTANTSVLGGPFVTLTAAPGATAGIITTTCMQRRWNPDTIFQIRTDNIGTIRHWHGWFSADPIGAAVLDGLTGMGWRYDTTADGTSFWRVSCNDGTATADAATVTTLAIAATTNYFLRILFDGTNVLFLGSTSLGTWNLYATISAKIPATSTALLFGSQVKDLAAGGVAFHVNRVTVNSK